MLLMVAGLAYPICQGWRSFLDMRTTEAHIRKVIGWQDSVTYLDEVLSLSAKMAAATGDLTWKHHYEEYGPRPKPVVEDVWHIAEKDLDSADIILTDFASVKLVAIEKRVFELVGQGDHDLAVMELHSSAYEDQRHAYNRGMKAFITCVQAILQNRLNEDLKAVRRAGALIGIILPVILLVWFVNHKIGRRLHVQVKTKQQINAFAREWQETFNAITDGVCIIDRHDGKIRQCNKAMTRLLGKPYNEIIGQSCCELLHGSSEPVKKCPFVRMVETRRSETTDFQVGDRWMNIKVDPYFNHHGDLVGAVHILSDITEQRKANKALKESENKFRLAFANAQDAIIWIDGETGTITNCNKATEELFGRKRREIIGQHHTAFYPEDKAQQYDGNSGRPGALFRSCQCERS